MPAPQTVTVPRHGDSVPPASRWRGPRSLVRRTAQPAPDSVRDEAHQLERPPQLQFFQLFGGTNQHAFLPDYLA